MMIYKQKGFSPILIVIIFSIVAALASGIAVYYYSVGKSQVDKKKVEEELDNLKKDYEKIKVENEQLKGLLGEENSTESWKTYTNAKYKFSIKYPSDWVYKDDYTKQDFVVFASKKEDFPKDETGQMSGISISITSPVSDSSRTKSPEKIQKEKITLGDGTKATKVTLLAGRPNDMNGESKIVSVEISLSNSKIISIDNVADYEAEVFNKMLQTFKLNK